MRRLILSTIVIFYFQFAFMSSLEHDIGRYAIIKTLFSPLNCVLVAWHAHIWYKAHRDAQVCEQKKEQLSPQAEVVVQYTELSTHQMMNKIRAQAALASIVGVVLATIGPILMTYLTPLLSVILSGSK